MSKPKSSKKTSRRSPMRSTKLLKRKLRKTTGTTTPMMLTRVHQEIVTCRPGETKMPMEVREMASADATASPEAAVSEAEVVAIVASAEPGEAMESVAAEEATMEDEEVIEVRTVNMNKMVNMT